MGKKPLPAYFLSLEVENLRCFGPKQKLDLSDGKGRPALWTVILGNNGVGKTTLLQSIAAMAPVEFEPGQYGPRGAGMLVHLGVWKPFRDGEDARIHVLYACALSSGDHPRYKLIHQPLSCVQRSASSMPMAGAPVFAHPELLSRFACYGYGAARRMGAGALTTGGELDVVRSLFDDEASLRNAEEWFVQADYASTKLKQAGQWRERVREILIAVLPEVEDVRIVIPGNVKIEAPRVEVLTPYGWVPMMSLSLGYRTLIAWMVDLASRLFERYPDSPNPLAEPAIVLVDEIDLHLHPSWQRRLMGFLTERFTKTQFIVTAHSPLVVQAAADANIVVLRREGDHVIIDNDVKAIRGWRVDQVLTSDLFGLESARPPQQEKLLKRRKEILSKGELTSRDRAELKRLEKALGPLPTGETPEDIEAMDIIRRAAARLKAEDA